MCDVCMKAWEGNLCYKERTFLLVRIVIKTELQLSLKQITDGLNIGFKETWYPLLQIHHIDLPKKGNDWVYFEQKYKFKRTAD